MSPKSAIEELEFLLESALALADKQKLWAVGAHLDHALVNLTGSGRSIARSVRLIAND